MSTGQPQGAPEATPPVTEGTQSEQARADIFDSVFDGKRDLLAERLTLMLLDIGGLVYEMAIRNHFRLDVLVQQAAAIQATDGELGQVDRLLRLGHAGAAGDCPKCGALFARGAAFCAQCGFELVKSDELSSEPHVAQPQPPAYPALEDSIGRPQAPPTGIGRQQ
jgi:hypothetical protein